MIEAGADVKLTYETPSARFSFDPQNSAHYHCVRAALHYALYAIANTKANAMNSAMPSGVFNDGMRLTQKVTMGATIVIALLAL